MGTCENLWKCNNKVWVSALLTKEVFINSHIASRHCNVKNDCNVHFHNFVLSTPKDWIGLDVSDHKCVERVVDIIRNKCIHCRKTPLLVRRLMQVTQIARHIRDILHMDYLSVDKVRYISTFVLIYPSLHTLCVWFCHCGSSLRRPRSTCFQPWFQRTNQFHSRTREVTLQNNFHWVGKVRNFRNS